MAYAEGTTVPVEKSLAEIVTLDEAFLPNLVMSDGCTVYERVGQPIALEYQSGKPVPMMLEGPR